MNSLSLKLSLPHVLTTFVLLVLFALLGPEQLSTITAIGFALFVVIVQFATSYYVLDKQLHYRLGRLRKYLSLVVSTSEAPEKPLHDNKGDDLANIINDLSDFISNLSGVLEEIRRDTKVFNEGAGRLTENMDSSVSIVDSTNANIAAMATSIEYIASTSHELTANANQVSDTTSQVMNLLSQGRNSSSSSQKSMAEFTQSVTGMAEDLALLQEESARIGSVLDVIRGIAEQTNLLALNAAIEAARAGEQGRGFAVVADEVRALAHRTQESTVEIQSMVEGLQEKSTKAVDAISKGQSLANNSLEQSENVVSALEQIGDAFGDVDSLTTQIAGAINQQHESTSSVNQSINSVVSSAEDLSSNLSEVFSFAKQQRETAAVVDKVLARVCV